MRKILVAFLLLAVLAGCGDIKEESSSEELEESKTESLGEGGKSGWTEDGSERGDTWELPSFSDDDGVEGEAEGYLELKPEYTN